VDADDGFAMLAQGVEAGIAQLQAQLVFALRSKTPMALVAGGKSRALAQFASVNFGMNFQRNHETLPEVLMARRVPRLRNWAG
jgi:hypothetical protein